MPSSVHVKESVTYSDIIMFIRPRRTSTSILDLLPSVTLGVTYDRAETCDRQ